VPRRIETLCTCQYWRAFDKAIQYTDNAPMRPENWERMFPTTDPRRLGRPQDPPRAGPPARTQARRRAWREERARILLSWTHLLWRRSPDSPPREYSGKILYISILSRTYSTIDTNNSTLPRTSTPSTRRFLNLWATLRTLPSRNSSPAPPQNACS